MNKALKSTALVAAGVAILSGVVAGDQASAWGPARDVYDYNNIRKSDWPKDKIVFNSIYNTPNFGDERAFVGAREYNNDDNGFENTWNNTSINVKDGQEYKLRLFVHNNSPWGRDGVATNVRASFSIPNVSSKAVKVSGFVYADNAETVWDSVTFQSDRAFHLEYVYGSAILGNSGIGNPANGKTKNPLGYELSDEVVTKSGGTLIGYDAIDGNIPGCYGFASYVTIRVKAVYDTDFEIEKEVRLAGETEWKNEVDAKVGDKVEYLITYKNTSEDIQSNVMIQDILPKNMRYVPNSTILYNGKHPSGAVMTDDDIAGTGVNIGSYGPGVTVMVKFTAEVIDKSLQCGGNILANWAQVTVNHKSMQDYAIVNHAKVCTEKEIPNTGPEALAGGAIATGSIVTAAGYFIASRRNLR